MYLMLCQPGKFQFLLIPLNLLESPYGTSRIWYRFNGHLIITKVLKPQGEFKRKRNYNRNIKIKIPENLFEC